MPAFAQLLVPLVVLALQDRTEARLRSFDQGDPRLDLANIPSVNLALTSERTEATLTYSPAFTLLAVGAPDFDFVTFHTVEGQLTYRFRRGFMSLRESANFGQNNFRLTLAPGVTDPSAPRPTDPDVPATPNTPSAAPTQGRVLDQVVWYASSTTTLTFGQSLSARTNLYEYATYGVRGGLDDVAAETYPLQQQLAVGTGVGVQVSRRDTLTSTIGGQQVRTRGFADAYVVGVQEDWARILSARVRGNLAAGLGYGFGTDLDGNETRRFFPTLTLRLTADVLPQASLNASVALAPVVDQFTGAIDQRVTWLLAFNQSFGKFSWTASANGTVSVDQSTSTSITSAGGTLGAFYQLSRDFSVDARASSSFQVLAGVEPSSLWIGLIGLTYKPTPRPL